MRQKDKESVAQPGARWGWILMVEFELWAYIVSYNNMA